MASLNLWQNGELVGEWQHSARGTDRFRYSASWLTSAAARPLSISFPWPVTASDWIAGDFVAAWFSNLLPDSPVVRTQIAQRFAINRPTIFKLLAEIGRDCVGAVQLLLPGEQPADIQSIQYEPLSDSEVAEELRRASSNPSYLINESANFRISLAGAQEKTALLFHEGQWCRPLGSTPTTHILKLPLKQIGEVPMPHSLENEWLCARILRAWGVATASAQVLNFEDQTCLAVERFDRRLAADRNWWMRLPQEDLCQALGVAPEHKYESDGGPGIRDCVNLLRQGSTNSADAVNFFRTQILFWLLQAPDGHAKNFSVQHQAGGGFHMTPLYDVLSTYPISGHGRNRLPEQRLAMAMAISGKNKHYRWAEILPRHWQELGDGLGLGAEVSKVLSSIPQEVDGILSAVAENLPDGIPVELSQPILDGVRKAAAKLG